MKTVIVVPSLKISGGIREVLRLANELKREGNDVIILALWRSAHEMENHNSVVYLSSWLPRPAIALFQLPILLIRFTRWLRQLECDFTPVIFTHYSTLPMAWLIPKKWRYFFVQDLEWRFPRYKLLSLALQRFILSIYQSGCVISANVYLSRSLVDKDVSVGLEAPIWADRKFLCADSLSRDIDFVMVLRKGNHKRLDLYLRFIVLASDNGVSVAVITPEDEIAIQVRSKVTEVHLRPNQSMMGALYARSSCFIHLSEHEGFGLPPLEAMGAGCIPLCRDSGGVRAFMLDGPVANLLLPLTMPIEEVFARALKVLRDPDINVLRIDIRRHFQQGLVSCESLRIGLVTKFLMERAQ